MTVPGVKSDPSSPYNDAILLNNNKNKITRTQIRPQNRCERSSEPLKRRESKEKLHVHIAKTQAAEDGTKILHQEEKLH